MKNPGLNFTSEAYNSRKKTGKVFECNICVQPFSSKQCLKEHFYTHTKEKPYVCRICQKSFRHASQMTLHKKIHLPSAQVLWPKLTDLMKNYKEAQADMVQTERKIDLPLISESQVFMIPKFADQETYRFLNSFN
jgi:uncharacterized Zn-finger protein